MVEAYVLVKMSAQTEVHGHARSIACMHAQIEAESTEELERIYFREIDKVEGIENSRLHIAACPRTRK